MESTRLASGTRGESWRPQGLASAGPEIVMQGGKERKASSHCTKEQVGQCLEGLYNSGASCFPWAGAVIVTSYSAPHPGRKTLSGCPGAAGCLCGRLSQGTAFNTPRSRVIGGNVHFRFYFYLEKAHKHPKSFGIAMQAACLPASNEMCFSQAITQGFYKVS